MEYWTLLSIVKHHRTSMWDESFGQKWEIWINFFLDWGEMSSHIFCFLNEQLTISYYVAIFTGIYLNSRLHLLSKRNKSWLDGATVFRTPLLKRSWGFRYNAVLSISTWLAMEGFVLRKQEHWFPLGDPCLFVLAARGLTMLLRDTSFCSFTVNMMHDSANIWHLVIYSLIFCLQKSNLNE